MYFPTLRGRRHELEALASASAVMIAAGNVTPIVEPVRARWAEIEALADAGQRFGLVFNPLVGNYSPPHPRARRVQLDIPQAGLDLYDHVNIVPTLYVVAGSPLRTVRDFHHRFDGRRRFIFVRSRPRTPGIMELADATPPERYLLSIRRVAPQPRRPISVDVSDAYRKRFRNADYPRDEPFSNRLRTIGTDPLFSAFGDYSIVGRAFQNSSGGSGTNNVAMHLVYSTAGVGSELRIRHYVSARADYETMCRQALALLVADLPGVVAMSPLNETPTTRFLRRLAQAGGHLSPGEGKGAGIRHHLELMTVVQ